MLLLEAGTVRGKEASKKGDEISPTGHINEAI
jgi:hypothetical protein